MSSDRDRSALAVEPSTHFAVRAEGLSKSYRLGALAGLGQTLSWISRRTVSGGNSFEAVHDVSFTVAPGECLGLVGANGSGKSTILHILAGITVPTGGLMRVRGRVLPTFAIGAGFHPDLTGRENVVLFGAIVGLPSDTTLEKLDAIRRFAEIDEHFDTPIKRYSDGMQARLAFAMSMLFPAEIYIFDEVLAFVDGDFRTRCLREIRRLAEAGKTVFFVSHNLEQVGELADSVMWLRSGRMHRLGPAADVLEEYERAEEHAIRRLSWSD